MRRKKADTILLIIEQNNEFYTLLKKKYRGIPNVIIKNGDVGNIKEYLVQYNIPHVNYIVSGLPFTSLPTDISDRILNITKEILGKKGRFITFQYTLLKLNFFKQYFKIRKVTLEFWNIPPAYVIVMTN